MKTCVHCSDGIHFESGASSLTDGGLEFKGSVARLINKQNKIYW